MRQGLFDRSSRNGDEDFERLGVLLGHMRRLQAAPLSRAVLNRTDHVLPTADISSVTDTHLYRTRCEEPIMLSCSVTRKSYPRNLGLYIIP